MKTTKYCSLFSIVIAFILGFFGNYSVLFAQSNQWAIKMFSEMGTEYFHDFGSVALHANVEHHFQFKNIYGEDVSISSVSSNCGCTKATASQHIIHPNEVAEIVARVDTSGREHTRQRKATIKVLFNKPTYAEVQLQVKTYIRPDVGFEPGIIEFGSVQHGQSVVKKAFLQYEGRPDWALLGIQKSNPGIRAEAREVRRQGGSVVYEILVELKSEAQAGYIQDLLKFQTNDRDFATSSIFLPVQGLVIEPMSAKPSFMQMGIVPKGQKIAKNLVISGSTPFKIVDIQSTDSRFSFLKTDLTRSVHVIPVVFKANGKHGKFTDTITVSTLCHAQGESSPQTLTIPVSGYVGGEENETESDLSVQEINHAETESSASSNENRQPTSKGIDSRREENDSISQKADLTSNWIPSTTSSDNFKTEERHDSNLFLEGNWHVASVAENNSNGTPENLPTSLPHVAQISNEERKKF